MTSGLVGSKLHPNCLDMFGCLVRATFLGSLLDL